MNNDKSRDAQINHHETLQNNSSMQRNDINFSKSSQEINRPLPLTKKQKPSLEYPLNQLGEILSNAGMTIKEGVQVPSAICGQSLLACASLLAQSHVNLVIDGRESPSSLFLLTIAESGDRKSATDKVVLKEIHAFERQEFKKYELEKKKFEKENQKYKESLREGKVNLGEEPTQPKSPLLTVQEPTYEGLVKHYERGSVSLSIFSDEGARMIGGHGMNKENKLKTIGGLCELWDGKHISRMRADAPAENLYDRRLSMHLLMQPCVSRLVLGDPMLEGQGFLARVLTWHPESIAGSRFYKRINVYNDLHVARFYDQVKQLLNLQKPEDLRLVSLSDEAMNTFEAFHDLVEERLSADGEFIEIKPFACKAAEIAARIALNLQFFHEPNLNEISDEWMKKGCFLMMTYLREACRLWGYAPVEANLSLAEKVLLWLKGRKEKTVTGQEIYQGGPKGVRSVQEAQVTVSILVEHGHLIPGSSNGSQSFGKRNWSVVDF